MTPSADVRGARARGASDSPAPALTDEGAWLELSVVADLEAVEAVSEILTRVAPGGTSVEPGFELVDEGLGARVDLARPAVVRAYLPARDREEALRAAESARIALGHLQAFELRPIGDLEIRTVHEAEWADAWKRHFPVLRIGRRIVIRPTWRRHRRAPDDVVLALDPGMAFGTGLHPTTRLCLAGIERWADEGRLEAPEDGLRERGAPARTRRLLDVGCGSGILAISALRLGPVRAVGLDTDPIAVEATIANARRNGVARRIVAIRGSLPSGRGPFDLVAANLIASLLVDLAPALCAELAAGGRMLASGIFVDREPAVIEAFEHAGLELAHRDADGEWVALEAVRSA